MLKNMHGVDEIAEQHIKDGKVLNKKFKYIEKKELKEDGKMIDPKYVFETKPKENKKAKKVPLRKPKIDTKKPTPAIKEWNY
jgi:hypothetical protein